MAFNRVGSVVAACAKVIRHRRHTRPFKDHVSARRCQLRKPSHNNPRLYADARLRVLVRKTRAGSIYRESGTPDCDPANGSFGRPTRLSVDRLSHPAASTVRSSNGAGISLEQSAAGPHSDPKSASCSQKSKACDVEILRLLKRPDTSFYGGPISEWPTVHGVGAT